MAKLKYIKPDYLGVDDAKDNAAIAMARATTAGSMSKVDMINGISDGFVNTNGIDTGASTDVYIDPAKHCRGGVSVASGTQDWKITGGVKEFTWTAPGGLTSLSNVLVVAGGGGGGASGGGGGSGGLVYKTDHPVTGSSNYTITIGDGGDGAPGQPTSQKGDDGENTVAFGMTANGGGGGGGGGSSGQGRDGGSAGGAGGNVNMYGGSKNQADSGGGTGYGNDGGDNTNNPYQATSGGGGAGGSGNNPNGAQTHNNRPTTGGNGGAGKDYSSEFGTSVGDDGWFAGGGGGAGGGVYGGLYGWGNNGETGKGGGSHGGSPGGGTQKGNAIDAIEHTGGGGGGGAPWNWYGAAGDGGSGAVVIKWAAFESYDDMSLISTATTAQAQPEQADIVLTYSNGYGTTTVGTDLRAYVSRDDGANYTEFTLVTKTPATGEIVVVAHGLDISGQPAGTSMRYKVTTHNQSANKSTWLHGASLTWR
jgi:hypothetical protein